MKLLRRLSTLGYGSRREVQALLRAGRVRDATDAVCTRTDPGTRGPYTVDGAPLDRFPPLTLLLHKPRGLETTRKSDGPIVYDCLPPRFLHRAPTLSPVGRLDKDTSGLLLFTDDGTLLHRLTHPRHHVAKTYMVRTARPIAPDTAAVFASGTLLLRSDARPLKPATLRQHGPCEATLILEEGRYHQVRRMFAAVHNHVERLHRARLGPLDLGDLEASAWRMLTPAEQRSLYAAVALSPPTT